MKKLLLLLTVCLTVVTSVQAQCDLDFSFSNTGTNMTAFFTPPAASSVYAELGDGVVGAFYTTEEGEYVCGASIVFTGNQIQLAVMADDATTLAKDGFSAGESIHWFYQTTDGNIYSLGLTPADNFVINGMSFISAASIEEVACGGDPSNGDDCPPLDTVFVNTGSNMTLFITPAAASDLSVLGNGTIAVYSGEAGEQFCAGSAVFTGEQTQITAMADDATTDVKDGFSDFESIVWKFQDTDGNQYDLTPNPADGFSLNGISFVMGISYEAISCAVDQEGCTDEAYLEYDPQATIDDGSCLDLVVYGCTGEAYLEYNSSANTDDGSCVTLIVEGCTDENYLEYVPSATIDDDSCLTLAFYGCTNDDYFEYNSSANVDDGMCTTVIVEGCTDIIYVEYNANANLDDGSCTTLIVEGCTDENATNFNTDANTNDDSCEYDLIPEDCQMSFETTNTGTNHTVMIPGLSTSVLSAGDLVGVFFITEDGSAVCAGSSVWTGNNMQIIAYGDDTTTPELDGLPVGAPFLFLAQSGDDLFMVDASFESSGMASYAVNGLSFVSGLDFNYACTVEYLGCTDQSACNYDSTANTDDGSCEYPEDFYNCSGSCTSDVDSDGVCDQLEIVGCMDVNAANYDANATDSGSCEYAGCTDENYLEYDSDATIDDDSSCMTLIVVGCTDENATNFNTDANTNDGFCEYDLIPEACQLSFETINTGTNHTVMIPGLSTNTLSAGDLIGVFFITADGSAVCAGSSEWTGNNMQIIAYGDDTTTPELDGLPVGAPFLFLAQSGDDLFMVDASFESSGMASYAVNGLSFVSGLDFNHACTVEYLGCTDATALNYDSLANTDDGTCVPYVFGCTDENATNFNTDANTNDGSCEYDLIPEDCQVSFETTNTGTNHTIMIPGLSTSVLSVGDLIGVFFITEDGSAVCAGSSEWAGDNMQIIAYGDDMTTPELDGLSVGAPFLFLAQSGDDLFMVDASFESSGMASYAVNGLSFVSGLDFNHACTVEHLGCTDVNACNYDATVNIDDGSCAYPDDFYNCSG
ncbi:MAG: hypothetical protein NZ604_07135, partial [Flavobacteriales bacterium]|nr:hypothetical protein [Flavobacteriales bacterium]